MPDTEVQLLAIVAAILVAGTTEAPEVAVTKALKLIAAAQAVIGESK